MFFLQLLNKYTLALARDKAVVLGFYFEIMIISLLVLNSANLNLYSPLYLWAGCVTVVIILSNSLLASKVGMSDHLANWVVLNRQRNLVLWALLGSYSVVYIFPLGLSIILANILLDIGNYHWQSLLLIIIYLEIALIMALLLKLIVRSGGKSSLLMTLLAIPLLFAPFYWVYLGFMFVQLQSTVLALESLVLLVAVWGWPRISYYIILITTLWE